MCGLFSSCSEVGLLSSDTIVVASLVGEQGFQVCGLRSCGTWALATGSWIQIGKGVRQGCMLSPCLFNLYAEYMMRNAGRKHKLESRLLGEISITTDMQMTPPLWQKMKKTKEPLDESERGE